MVSAEDVTQEIYIDGGIWGDNYSYYEIRTGENFGGIEKGGSPIFMPTPASGTAGIKLLSQYSKISSGLKLNRISLLSRATNSKLIAHIKNLTKGSKTTFQAVRAERATGLATKGRYHFKKLVDERNGLLKLWRDRSNLNSQDREIVKKLLIEAQKALSGS